MPGFHGDHAYAAFHPSDVREHGVFTPDMKIPADLVAAGAQGFLAAGAAMMLPTVGCCLIRGGLGRDRGRLRRWRAFHPEALHRTGGVPRRGS
jgi:hypothetical protein